MKRMYCKQCGDLVAVSPEPPPAPVPVPVPVPQRSLSIDVHEGERASLRPLFRLADDSETEIDSYLNSGVLFTVRDADEVVGYLLLTETEEPSVREIKSMAIVESMQGGGLGRGLVQKAITHCEELRAQAGPGAREEVQSLVVATAAAGLGQLRFYQRLGFRMLRIEREAFGPHNGYAADLSVNGIPLRDRVWLSMELPLTAAWK